MINSKKYQEVNKKAYKKIKKIDDIGLNKEEWNIIDEALTMAAQRDAEYSRIAYQQGFKDAVDLFAK